MTSSLKKFFEYGAFFCLSAIICMSLSQSPIYQYYRIDTSIYQYIGKMITDGYIPYRDVWDHKGPLVYLWHALGYKIYPMHGIYTLEVIWLSFSLILAYKMAQNYIKKIYAAFIVVLLFLTTPTSDTIGNTETLALFPLMLITYTTQKYIANNAITKKDSFLIGFMVSALILIKPLYLVIPGIFCLYICIDLIKKAKYKELRKFVLAAGIGFILPLSAVLYWLYVNDALKDFYDDYVVFNLLYTVEHHERGKGTILKTFLFFIRKPAILLALISTITILVKYKEHKPVEKRLINLFLITFTLTFISLIIPRNRYVHYLVILYPIILFFLIFMFKLLKSKVLRITLLEIGIFIFSFHMYDDITSTYKKFLSSDQECRKIADIVKKNLGEKETFVSLIDDYAALYLYTDHYSASRYPHISNVDQLLHQQVKKEFEKIKPHIIVGEIKKEVSIISKNPLQIKAESKIAYSDLFNPDDYKIIHKDKYPASEIVIFMLKDENSAEGYNNE